MSPISLEIVSMYTKFPIEKNQRQNNQYKLG
jgi:hypothetical protein